MAKSILAAFAGAALIFSGSVCADAFGDGMSFGKGQQSTGTNAIKNFKPEEVIPDYTTRPSETGYYGGVTSSGVDMTTPGSNALNTSNVGQSITESILNTPADNKPSLDAPFISAGISMQDNAENVVDPGFDECQEQNATFTEITTHQCNRTPAVELSCIRKAHIGGKETEVWVTRAYHVSAGLFRYSAQNGGFFYEFRAPASGQIISATLNVTAGQYMMNAKTTFMNTTFNLTWGASFTLNPAGMAVNEGDYYGALALPMNGQSNASLSAPILAAFNSGKNSMTIDMVMKVKDKGYEPSVEWTESCPFNKAEEVLMTSVCTEAGGTKTINVGGVNYPVYSDCWAFKDVYVSQEADNGTCNEYMNNKSCTVNGTTCLESLAGVCLSEMATFSCENKISGTGMMCGGEFFCTDGSCAQGETGTNNMFAKAVSTLAAVAAAGEDIAEFNEANVRAFTGTAQRCRKAMAGFSNCCKDSGWGNDVGLASCSSEEKALGKAKSKLLTVKIGTFCAHKVLGVCVEKKESYCQFDSKLAQIVQSQGRKGQLGIGFGSASSPNCRGITIDELQSINFDTLNFANFYSDLEDGSTIPEDSELLEKAKQIIADKMVEAGK